MLPMKLILLPTVYLPIEPLDASHETNTTPSSPMKLILLSAAHLPILTLNASYEINTAILVLPTYQYHLLTAWGVTNPGKTENLTKPCSIL